MSIKIKNLVILRSSTLLDRAKSSSASGYKYSHHQEGLSEVEQALKAVSIPYEYLDENDFRIKGDLVGKKSPKIIIIPEMRTCGDDTFQKLKDYAEKGWIIFAIFDAFYYRPVEGKEPERYIQQRMKDLFQLTTIDISDTERDLTEVKISFPKNRYSWLTDGLQQPTTGYRENMVLGIIAESNASARHGDVKAIKISKDSNGKELRTPRSYPAFLIREYDSGGLFIYSTFLLRKIDNYQLVFKNLYRHKVPRSNTRQVRLLTWLVVVEAVIIGFLVARDFMNTGNSWATQIGIALISGIVGWLITKAMKFFENLLKDS